MEGWPRFATTPQPGQLDGQLPPGFNDEAVIGGLDSPLRLTDASSFVADVERGCV
jgi:hypothetical protein